jgi:hypothetical protein
MASVILKSLFTVQFTEVNNKLMRHVFSVTIIINFIKAEHSVKHQARKYMTSCGYYFSLPTLF